MLNKNYKCCKTCRINIDIHVFSFNFIKLQHFINKNAKF